MRPTLWAALIGVLFFFNAFAAAFAQQEKTIKNPQMAGIMYARTSEQNQKVFLPLKRTDVHMDVIAGVVKAKVTQVFFNETGTALEAIYVFPLPAKAAVTDMVLKVENRIIRSVVQERREAKKTYETAKAAGKKTALLEQERPNIFTTSVANFLPGETVEISLSYIETMAYQKGVYTVNFPMVVGQRYIPTACGGGSTAGEGQAVQSGVPDAKRLNPPLLHPNIDSRHRLSLRADIAGIPVDRVISNTHDVILEKVIGKGDRFRVFLTDEVTVPDSDFNMKIYLGESDGPQMAYTGSDKGEDAYGMLTVFPPLSAGQPSPFSLPRDVVFLIDTSGSMSGTSISQARAGLTLCLQMLRQEDRFTIVRFSSNYSYFSPDLVPVTAEALSAARAYIDTLYAGGGTEMQQALQYVLGIPKKEGSMKMVVFLTDGAVGNEDSLIKLLSNHLGQGRLFTFGIGSAPNGYLMKKMAEIGRGQSQFIHSQQDIGEVMANFFKTLDSPVLTDISLAWKDESGNMIEGVEFYPDPCPDVFYQRPLQVFIRHPGRAGRLRGKLILNGRLAGKPVEYEYLPDDRESRQLDTIDRMFGKRKIEELMYRRIRSHSPEEQACLRDEIIEVSLFHQILSKFTARVAVEEQVTKNPQGELKTVKVQVPLPKGWNPSAFGLSATATDNALLLLLGLVSILAGIVVFIIRRFVG